MLIFRGGNWPEHRSWCAATVLATVAATAWYVAEGLRSGQWTWPSGSSAPGFAFGVVGGLIIVFEMLLWVRKKYRVVRIGRAMLWMKAHIWLGLLTLPLMVLHSGFRWWDVPLSGALMMLFLVVIASGIWGLVLQQILPTVMLEELPAETIRSQIDYILGQYLAEARRIVRITCGKEGDLIGPAVDGPAGGREDQSFLVIGAVRTTGRVQGKVLQTAQVMPVPNSEPLLTFFDKHIVPFLEAKQISGRSLASAKRADALFRDLKTSLDPRTHPVVDSLADLCDQRRQFARQARLHGWLHGWLLVHLPVSVSMFVLMIIHVFYALRYF
ncbi:MAG: hypothetical protein JO252_27055 [Planctomycetaceae bacterium]|nr:hypothetical protein [Planctomycetaceae bacterium]